MKYCYNSDSPKKGDDEYEPDVTKRVRALENDILKLQEHNATLRILLNFLKAKIKAMTHPDRPESDSENDNNNNSPFTSDFNNNAQFGPQFGEEDHAGVSGGEN